MASRLYYLLTFLPQLPPLGEPPGIPPDEVESLLRLEEDPALTSLGDLIHLERWLKTCVEGRILRGAKQFPPGPVPELVSPTLAGMIQPEGNEPLPEDAFQSTVWREFFRIVEQTGRRVGSRLLSRWAVWETDLREKLAVVRQQLACQAVPGEGVARPPSDLDRQILASLPPGRQFDHVNLLGDWMMVQDPMDGERLLDEARWSFLDRGAGRFTFVLDELVAYLLKLRLLIRYSQLQRQAGIDILKEVTAL